MRCSARGLTKSGPFLAVNSLYYQRKDLTLECRATGSLEHRLDQRPAKIDQRLRVVPENQYVHPPSLIAPAPGVTHVRLAALLMLAHCEHEPQ